MGELAEGRQQMNLPYVKKRVKKKKQIKSTHDKGSLFSLG